MIEMMFVIAGGILLAFVVVMLLADASDKGGPELPSRPPYIHKPQDLRSDWQKRKDAEQWSKR